MGSAVIPIVFVVDGDLSVLASLECLICYGGWRPRTFESAREFMAQPRPFVPSCLILAVAPGNPEDLEIQMQIACERPEIPIVVISRCGDIPTAVKAMKAGAIDLLVNPFSSDALLGAIRQGLERSGAALHREVAVRALRERHASLTHRERQIMTLVAHGRLNKLIASELGISEVTVKAHRGRVMRKMNAPSLAALVDMAGKLNLTRFTPQLRLAESSRASPPLQPAAA